MDTRKVVVSVLILIVFLASFVVGYYMGGRAGGFYQGAVSPEAGGDDVREVVRSIVNAASGGASGTLGILQGIGPESGDEPELEFFSGIGLDPWGGSYRCLRPTEGGLAALVSFGPNGKLDGAIPGTDDIIVVFDGDVFRRLVTASRASRP